MALKTLIGPILRKDGPVDGFVTLEDGYITEVGSGDPGVRGGEDVVRGLIIPGFMNMHTHLGDHMARGHLPLDIEEAVCRGGIKHRVLDNASRQELVSSIRSSIKEVHSGSTILFDFRESGLSGLEALEEASEGWGPDIVALGRPSPGEDPGEVLSRCHGFGLSSIGEQAGDLRILAEEENKLFAIHASEGYREEVGPYLDLNPDLLVHMVSGDPEDWKEVARASIPVAVCPRSNMSFGLGVPIADMMDAGLMLCLGTDNSMASLHDMFREMEWIWMALRAEGYDCEKASRVVFGMAAGEGLVGSALLTRSPRWRRWWEEGWPNPSDRAHLCVIEMPDVKDWEENPFSHVVRFSGNHSVLFTGP